MAVAEGGSQDLVGGGVGSVVHLGLDAQVAQLGGQDVGGVGGVAVHGGVGDDDAVLLGGVGGPLDVLLQELVEFLAPDEAVERADHLDLDGGGLLQDGLDLGPVFAHDVGVVAAGLVDVVVEEVHLVGEQRAVEGAEGAEGVGGEEDLLAHIVGDHDLGPVDHGGGHEGEGVAAGAEGVALVDQVQAAADVEVKELLHHFGDLLVADDGHVGIAQHQLRQGGGVVHLHVLHDDIVQLAAAEHVGHVLQILAGGGGVHRVEHDGLVVQQDIGVVGNALGDLVDALEQGQAAVIGADPVQIAGYIADTIHVRATSFLLIHRSSYRLVFTGRGGQIRGQSHFYICIIPHNALFLLQH